MSKARKQSMPVLVSVCGPTGIGKSDLALALAQHFQTEILSADARQFYREMSIGTAKPTEEELSIVKHHFINTHSVTEHFSAGKFEQDALQCLEELFQQHRVVIMAGGSGLFLKAIWDGLDELPGKDEKIRAALNQTFQTQGLEALQAMLKKSDPAYYRQVDLKNPRRLIRALEVCEATGKPYSSYLQQQPAKRPFRNIKIGLYMDRPALYERINARVDAMMDDGLLREARHLFPQRHLVALQTVGYQELFDHLEGKINLPSAVELIKKNSRHYAKRQMTWFRKDRTIEWFGPEDRSAIIAHTRDQLEDR